MLGHSNLKSTLSEVTALGEQRGSPGTSTGAWGAGVSVVSKIPDIFTCSSALISRDSSPSHDPGRHRKPISCYTLHNRENSLRPSSATLMKG